MVNKNEFTTTLLTA